MKPKGPTPAILFSPDGLNLRRISDIYVESHTVLYGRTMTLADNRTRNALESKLERQSLWTTKITRNGIQVWDSVCNEAITTSPVSVSKWSKIKKTIQDILTQKHSDYWRDYIRPLIQQGKMLEFIYLEQSDLTWRSIIYDLPRGVLSFAVRSSIDFLPTLSNLKCWGKRTNARCPLCKNNETLCHVLNNCSVSLNQGRYTWRHDSILRHIVQLLQAPSTKSDVKMYADIDGMTSSGGTIPAYILPTSQRPDLFLYNEKAKKAIIAELTVPFEPNIPNAHEIKQSRYAGLLSDLNRAGVNTSLVCFEIGSRGLITQDNVARIRSILKFKGVSFKKQISRDISKLALLGSYAIWNSRKEAIWDNISCLKINGA